MQMTATILSINPRSLTVRNEETGETIIVNVNNPRRFGVGQRVRITYSGIMTMSEPPQITATNIQIIPALPVRPPVRPPVLPVIPPIFNPPPRQIRARVIRREQNFLIVQNTTSNQILRVDTANARFFCPGGIVTITFNTITPGIPPRIELIDINPVC